MFAIFSSALLPGGTHGLGYCTICSRRGNVIIAEIHSSLRLVLRLWSIGPSLTLPQLGTLLRSKRKLEELQNVIQVRKFPCSSCRLLTKNRSLVARPPTRAFNVFRGCTVCDGDAYCFVTAHIEVEALFFVEQLFLTALSHWT